MDDIIQEGAAMTNPIAILEEIRRLKKQNTKLAIRNIILTADIELIAEDPDSPLAKKIIARYKHSIELKKQREQETQN